MRCSPIVIGIIMYDSVIYNHTYYAYVGVFDV